MKLHCISFTGLSSGPENINVMERRVCIIQVTNSPILTGREDRLQVDVWNSLQQLTYTVISDMDNPFNFYLICM